jgi:hypothetical protein
MFSATAEGSKDVIRCTVWDKDKFGRDFMYERSCEVLLTFVGEYLVFLWLAF